jgi:hypothetical protein
MWWLRQSTVVVHAAVQLQIEDVAAVALLVARALALRGADDGAGDGTTPRSLFLVATGDGANGDTRDRTASGAASHAAGQIAVRYGSVVAADAFCLDAAIVVSGRVVVARRPGHAAFNLAPPRSTARASRAHSVRAAHAG